MKRSPLGYLAAEHPVAYVNLVDCCIRSQRFAATHVLAAAEVLGEAFSATAAACRNPAQDGAAMLANPAAVEAFASALASLVKKAAVSIRSAGSMQSLPRPRAGTDELSNYCFAAAAPTFTCALLHNAADFLSSVAEANILCAAGSAPSSSSSSSGGSSGSSSRQQQHLPSLALLTVLLARSLAVLADALEAAAAVAETSPAQLFAR
jgi:hypothetical protein